MVKNLPAVRETQARSLVREDPQKKERQPTPAFLPREFHGLHSLCGRKELDTTERLSLSLSWSREKMQRLRCWSNKEPPRDRVWTSRLLVRSHFTPSNCDQRGGASGPSFRWRNKLEEVSRATPLGHSRTELQVTTCQIPRHRTSPWHPWRDTHGDSVSIPLL